MNYREIRDQLLNDFQEHIMGSDDPFATAAESCAEAREALLNVGVEPITPADLVTELLMMEVDQP